MNKFRYKTVKKSVALLILTAMMLTRFLGTGSLLGQVHAADKEAINQESQIAPAEPEASDAGVAELEGADGTEAVQQETAFIPEDYALFAGPADNLDFMEDSLKNSLRTYVSFNEDNSNDITGRITTVTSGAIQYIDGKRGRALRLDGNGYLSLGKQTYGQNSFTFAFWEKTAPGGSGDIAFLSNKDWTGSGSAAGYAFTIDDKTDVNGSRSTLWFNIAPGRVDVRDAADPKLKVADDTWHHIIGAVDRSTGNLSVYIDGTLAKSASIAGTGTNSIDTGFATVLGGSDGGKALIKADFDEFALFDRALTADEAAKLYGYYIEGPIMADKIQLNKVISEAQNLYNNSAGAEAAKKEALQVAIVNSDTVLGNAAADQTAVDEAVKTLYQAIRTFKGVKMSFQVLSDIHISKSESSDKATSNFIRALKDIQAADTDSQALVITGDITDGGKDSEYDALNSILASNSHPSMYYVTGNHDVRYMGAEAFDRFKAKTNMPGIYYKEEIGGYIFLFLGSEQNLKDAAYLSEEQFTWLENELENAPEDKPVFLFLHQPLYGLLQGTERWEKTDWVIQQVRLRKLLGKYPQALFFSGHTHYTLQTSFVYDEKYCTMFNTGGTYYMEDAITYGGAAGSQGLYIEVYDNKVVVRGREFADNSWIETAVHTVDYPVTKEFLPVDLEQPAWDKAAKITVSELTENAAFLEWTLASDNVKVEKYRIYAGNTLIDTVAGDINRYQLTALKSGTEYTIKITAMDEEENESDAIAVQVKTKESDQKDNLDFLDASLKESLIAYLSFNGHNSDLTDKINTQSSGTMEYAEGKRGKALKLSGSNYISLGDITYGQDSFSFAFWEKSTAPSEDTSFISNKDWGSGANSGWVVGHDNGNRSNLWFNIASQGEKRYDVRGTRIADDLWHYVAVSVDRSKGQVTIYVDGKKASVTDISAINGKSIDTGLPTIIGADGNKKYPVKGEIDEMAIFRKALSEQEVKLLMASDQPEYEISSSFKVTEISGGDAIESTISSMEEGAGKYVNAYVDVTSNQLTAKSLTVVAVSYDKYGAMLTSSSSYSVVNPFENTGFELGMLASKDVAQIKLFVLNAKDYMGIYEDINYTPISDPIVLN